MYDYLRRYIRPGVKPLSETDSIREAARRLSIDQLTDLLIVEATLPRPERTGVRGHLTPQEAAEHACRANVKQVLLTHVSDELDELWVRGCARRAFEGPISVAREGAVFEA